MQRACDTPPKGLWDRDPHRFLLGRSYHLFAEVVGWDEAIRIGCLVHQECRPPSQRMGRRSSTGRGMIQVPKAFDAKCRFAEIAGEASARKLIAALGGEVFEFSNILAADRLKQQIHIARMVRDGASGRAVAAAWGITDRQVRRIARAHGLPPSITGRRRRLDS